MSIWRQLFSRSGGPRATFVVLAAAALAFSALQSLIVPVIPYIETTFATDQRTVTWVITAYLLSASVSTPLLGRAGDMFGKRRMLVLTLVALSLGSLMAALAPSIGWLIVARVVQGVGGGVMPLAFGIISDEFDRKRMPGVIAALAGVGALGYGVGIVAAGPIVEHLGFPWLFWLPMIVTAVAALTAALLIPDSPHAARARLPLLPATILSILLVALLVAISEGETWGWLSPPVLALVAVAAVGSVLWVRVELRVAAPLIDMTMMRLRGVWTANLVSALLGAGMFAGFGFLPQLIQTPTGTGYGLGATMSESGQVLLPSALAMFVVGFVTGPLVRRLGSRAVIVLGCLVGAVSFFAVAAFHATLWHVAVAMTTVGVGLGLVFSTIAAVVVMSVPAHQTGVASGMNANIRTIGGAIGAAVLGGLVTAQVGSGGYPAEVGYTIGFSVLGGAMLLAAATGLLTPDSHEPPSDGPLSDAGDAEVALLPGATTRR